jgi:phage tail tape-measure protein
MEGSVETREDFVKKLLAKGTMSPEEISRTLDLDLLWVKELADSLRKA